LQDYHVSLIFSTD